MNCKLCLAIVLFSGFAFAATSAKPGAGAPALHGQKLAEAYCAGCHGVDGSTTTDPQYPKIAGQKAYYLRQQLRAFKSGARKSDIMSGPAAAISNAQIRELARYYSDQRVKPDVVKDPKLAAAGARIYRYASRVAPACAACHGGGGFGRRGGMMGGGGGMGGMMGGRMGMMGNTAAVPNLNGQHAAYIVQQLDALASGARRGTVMGPIASAWREQDRRAVAEYLSGLR
jgi:cytochrome c553